MTIIATAARDLDHAMLRRLEKRILVDLPTPAARQAMISHWLPPLSSSAPTGGVELRTELDYEVLATVRSGDDDDVGNGGGGGDDEDDSLLEDGRILRLRRAAGVSGGGHEAGPQDLRPPGSCSVRRSSVGGAVPTPGAALTAGWPGCGRRRRGSCCRSGEGEAPPSPRLPAGIYRFGPESPTFLHSGLRPHHLWHHLRS